MKIYISIDNENRLLGWGSTCSSESDIEIEVHEDHEVLRNPFIFKYENDELIKDTEYQQQLIRKREEIENQPTLEERIQIMQKALDDLLLGGME
ncbi:hypothetical protein AZI98_08915 [Aeribacillus pallidus]|uniref:Uncharacterized protein n=1 Tax=Aeribacillus pallidus TaxID=33936 RepID=A0A165XLW3_9BACI|nr:hypothetical protein [Aeribacillus pallidus]KZN96174.1 hypothetical protein AZI98_08915 [Aeribacillus pallidus]